MGLDDEDYVDGNSSRSDDGDDDGGGDGDYMSCS